MHTEIEYQRDPKTGRCPVDDVIEGYYVFEHRLARLRSTIVWPYCGYDSFEEFARQRFSLCPHHAHAIADEGVKLDLDSYAPGEPEPAPEQAEFDFMDDPELLEGGLSS